MACNEDRIVHDERRECLHDDVWARATANLLSLPSSRLLLRCGDIDEGARATMSVRVEEEEYRNQHHGVDAYAIVVAESSVRAPPFQPRLNNEDDNDWNFGLFASTKSWLRSQHDRLHQLELE